MDTPDFEDMTISLYGTVPDSIVDGPGLRYAVFVQGCSHRCPGCHNPESQPACGGTIVRLADLVADIEANGLVHNVTLSGGEPFEQPVACALLAAELKRCGYGIWCYTGYLYEDLQRRAEAARETLAEMQRAAGESNVAAASASLADSADAVGACLVRSECCADDGDCAVASDGNGSCVDTPGNVGSRANASSNSDHAETLGSGVAEGVSASLANDLAVGQLLDCIDVLVDGPFVEARKSLELKWCGSSNQRLIDVLATRKAGSISLWHPTTFNLAKPSNW